MRGRGHMEAKGADLERGCQSGRLRGTTMWMERHAGLITAWWPWKESDLYYKTLPAERMMGVPHPSSGAALQPHRAQRERRKKQPWGSTCCRLHEFWSQQAVFTLPLLPLLPGKPLLHHGHLLESFLTPLAGISPSASPPPVWPLPETPSSTPVCSLGPSTAPGLQ